MSSVTAWAGHVTAHVVRDCRLVVLRWQRSCLQNCCASDWQQVFECRQNAVVWHGRQPGKLGHCQTRTGTQESQSWKRHAAAQEASAAGRAQARYDHITWCPSQAFWTDCIAGSMSVWQWCRSTAPSHKTSVTDHTVLPANNLHVCLYFVNVHPIAPPLIVVTDIWLQFTTYVLTPKGWKAELT